MPDKKSHPTPMSVNHTTHAARATGNSGKPASGPGSCHKPCHGTRITASRAPYIRSNDKESPTNLPKGSATESRLYVLPQRGQQNMSLNVQLPSIQVLIKTTIHSLVGNTLFNDTFQLPLKQDKYFRNLLHQLAMDLDLRDLVDAIQDDGHFLQLVTQLHQGFDQCLDNVL
jgi:hypothetical protein